MIIHIPLFMETHSTTYSYWDRRAHLYFLSVAALPVRAGAHASHLIPRPIPFSSRTAAGAHSLTLPCTW